MRSLENFSISSRLSRKETPDMKRKKMKRRFEEETKFYSFHNAVLLLFAS
jgi:hypothetical protein